MNGFENDADMKIVGDERPAPPDTAAKWQQQKACGNIDRAHRLGAVLAQQLMNIEEPDAARRCKNRCWRRSWWTMRCRRWCRRSC